MKAFQDRQFNFPSKRLGLATTFLVSLSSVWTGLMMEMIKQSPATKDGVKKVYFNDGSGWTQKYFLLIGLCVHDDVRLATEVKYTPGTSCLLLLPRCSHRPQVLKA